MAQRFNPAPGWPTPPAGWLPPPGWRPDPTWPAAPEGWVVVVDDTRGPALPQTAASATGQVVRTSATTAPRTVPAAHGQTVLPRPVHDPDLLWEGSGKPLVGLNPGQYRLTRTMLFFERGLLSTNLQQVPVIDVLDVDVMQSIIQKQRGVGTVIVHVGRRHQPAERVLIEDIEDFRGLQSALNRAVRDIRLAAHVTANTHRILSGPAFPSPPVPAQRSVEHRPSQLPRQEDDLARLERLAKLHAAGALTDAEFQEKKSELLSRL